MSFKIAGKAVWPVGFGALHLTNHHAVPPVTREQAIPVLKAAIEAGANFINAGWIYGTPAYNSLHLLNAYFTKYPEDAAKAVISVKGCFDFATMSLQNDTEGVRKSIDECLNVADGKFEIDIFEAGRLDPDVPVETTVAAIAEYVKAGKIGGIGLSECSAKSIRRAQAVHPIAAVEVELSLFEPGPLKNGIVDVCKEFNIPILAYSPVGRGFLTGKFQTFDDLPKTGPMTWYPRFSRENFDHNNKLGEAVKHIADKKSYTVAQVAIAWAAAQSQVFGTPIIPIPGTTRVERVAENTTIVKLDASDMQNLDEILGGFEVKGARAPAMMAKYLEV